MKKKILVCTNANIGDFVMATSAIALLKKSFPENDITVLLAKNSQPLAENNKYIDALITHTFNIRTSWLSTRIKQLIWAIKNYSRIKKERFDICIFLDSSPFLTTLMKLLKVPIRIGPSTYWTGVNVPNPDIKKLTHCTPLPPDSDRLHMSERYQTVVRNFFTTLNIEIPKIPSSDKFKSFVKPFFKEDASKKICLCLRGSKNSRNEWPLSYFKRTVELIKDKSGSSFYIIGGSSDSGYADNFIKAFNVTAVNLCGKFSLLQTAEFIKQSDLVISVDTGIAHLAATTQTPIIALYGRTLPENSGAVSPKAVYMYAGAECSPCNYSNVFFNQKCGRYKCLENIMPEQVAKSALRVLTEENS